MLRAWDGLLARRAASIAALAAAVALLAVVATDDGAPWSQRLAMIGALAPVAGAIGAYAARAIASSRGELRALEALGVEPLRAVLGAVAGGIALALAGPAALALPTADLAALFPRPPAPQTWVADGATAMRELGLGIRIASGGVLERTASAAPAHAIAAVPREAAIAAVALLAVATPLWGASAMSASRRVAVGLAAVVAAIVTFQAVAAGRLSPGALAAAPLVLLVDLACARYLRSRGAA